MEGSFRRIARGPERQMTRTRTLLIPAEQAIAHPPDATGTAAVISRALRATGSGHLGADGS
jgi:hypothetical protein